jgi:hypothetical protein
MVLKGFIRLSKSYKSQKILSLTYMAFDYLIGLCELPNYFYQKLKTKYYE